MTLYKHNDHPNSFVSLLRRLYNPIGFKKGYNFTLFFILAGALFGFSLASSPKMNVNGYLLSHTAPGEAYWYRKPFHKTAISLHLTGAIPASLLVVWQFVPVIRYKALIFHRINGYAVLLFLLVGNIGALISARHAFGGSLAVQTAVGVGVIATTTSSVLAYVNMKKLQIEQHRAWMLRTWIWAGSIITVRLIQVMSVQIISKTGSYRTVMPCAQIDGAGGDVAKYAGCQVDPEGYAVVNATWAGAGGIEAVAGAFHVTFVMALWLAFFIHAVGVELYLRLTTAEAERLRKVSYERQLERGMIQPGSAGLTSDRLGDCGPWRMPVDKVQDAAVGDRKVHGPVVDSESASDISKPAAVLGWGK
ncbi:hypothetical protein CLAFUW4_12539 [Fulvia fulva]|uniref:Uncharacterized protein n=1 Tax=Passalora fulva TaxID=5499 RepID=A0A9Q8USL9_PASFU|nr:uncharacterized protein CLAFUR5_11565 [Fulvia fulva]KAK4618221.1 hypothetical protein CLAFUR4_12544 [Fulvia fulva]KAK4618394.1 hypothetical protein CLAFUR0_12555 [Fulvia fulva]UJO20964.1 hypothetical protein CLAFUR5_11565 [Fulvia fulva]WPV18627.1 hypothetical protein CLAFUW4_12539 [Fulvia fulva]WPV32821.1 hypothetical protein CLAFUW7_12546 [Fulvia fulva]